VASVTRQRQHGHDLTQVRPQLVAHLLGSPTDIAGEQRIAVRLGMLAYGLRIHQR